MKLLDCISNIPNFYLYNSFQNNNFMWSEIFGSFHTIREDSLIDGSQCINLKCKDVVNQGG